jgi:hypothetical protein
MQTAVEFLLSHMWTTDWVNYTREQKLNVIQQAKEMEKHQIIESYDKGEFNQGCNGTAEEYYNKTFKSE